MIKVIFGNSYMLEMLQGDYLPRVINGRCLKKYFPSVWQEFYSALQIMADTCIALRTKMTVVCNALRSRVADELDIIAIWSFMFLGSCKLKTGGHILAAKLCQMRVVGSSIKFLASRRQRKIFGTTKLEVKRRKGWFCT